MLKSSESSVLPREEAPPSALFAEGDRAAILASYGLDSLEDDPELAAIAGFAAQLCQAPVSLISLVESDRQRFLARSGVELRETPRADSFCAYAMLRDEPMQVPDVAGDPRFADNALVTGAQQVRFYAGAPLVSPEGAPLGALCVIDRVARPDGLNALQREGLTVLATAVMRRLAARRKSREASHEQTETARRLREIADLLPAIVWSADGDGAFDYFNRKWADITGRPQPTQASEWRPVIHDDDADGTFASWDKSFAAGEPFESEYRLRHADGSWRWTLARALPLHGPDGKVSRWYGTLTDIDSGHRLSQNRDLLARELSHRIKNIFAVVAGLVSIRARQQPESQKFADELIGAIRALGRAHDFVRPTEGEKGESLRGLLGELLAPYVGKDGGKLRIEGGDCTIGPRAATPLALVFHELATNSAKYGAFSSEEGKVEITLDCPDDDALTHVRWRESGGPEVSEVSEEGFGSRLILMAIEGQLGGKIERRFAPEGLQIDLEMKAGAIRS